MRKYALLSLVLLWTALCSAQSSQKNQVGSQNPVAAEAQANTSEVAVVGCLRSSSGKYTLTEKSGTNYSLEGAPSALSGHVGQEVRVTAARAASPESSTAAEHADRPVASNPPTGAHAEPGSNPSPGSAEQKIDESSRTPTATLSTLKVLTVTTIAGTCQQ